jgi:hypothetical protein
MTANQQIANNYAKTVAAMCNDKWTSNLSAIPKRERDSIIAIYRRYFSNVVIDKRNDTVICYK